jgi:hypothetical protein
LKEKKNITKEARRKVRAEKGMRNEKEGKVE